MTFEPSPDRPVSFLHKLVGFKDLEPPISDGEYALYKRFRDGRDLIPLPVAKTLPECPRNADRRSRTAIRRLISDPRLPTILKLIEEEKVRAEARRKAIAEERKAAEAKAETEALRTKLEKIDAFHGDQLNVFSLKVGQFEHLIGAQSLAEASLKITHDSYSEFKKSQRALNINMAQKGNDRSAMAFGVLAAIENNLRNKGNARGIAAGLSTVTIRRSLVALREEERAALRMTDILEALGVLDADDRLAILVPIIWNDGNCDIDFSNSSAEFRVRAATLDTLKPLISASLGTAEGAREHLNQALRKALNPASGLPEAQRGVIERYLFSGNRWMTPGEGAHALLSSADAPAALRLGGLSDDSEMMYDLRESLLTVAPPGSGKSQAHVLRNLLYLKAPAVILDVKGEMLRDSRTWRDANVGKTYAFTPHAPEDSIHYNPLDDIRNDPDLAWEDARKLADLIVIPTSARETGDYFESRARDMITTALLDVAISTQGKERTMAGVLDRLYVSDDESILKWCKQLDQRGNVQLARQASALRGMPPKQREGVFDSARRQLEIWQSPAITKITGNTNFDPAKLRSENGTLYLAVALEDIKRYASVLRVLIGQTLFKLYRQKPEADALPVTFFLDELPRLGRMDVIEESLDVGRSYAVRLWMFCQNFGQLETAYPNAQGMMSNCAVRCFMNPDEDTARWLSQNLGMRQGLLDGARKPLVEPHQLTGPEFAQQLVVFSRGSPPARLTKKPAFGDPVCLARMAGVADIPQEDIPQEETSSPIENPEEARITWDDIGPGLNIQENVSTPPIVEHNNRSSLWIAIGAGCILLALIGWGATREVQFRGLKAENVTLQSTHDADAQAIRASSTQKALLLRTIRETEQARDSARTDASLARTELQRERDAHAATKRQLAMLESRPVTQAPPTASETNRSSPLPTASPRTYPSFPAELPGQGQATPITTATPPFPTDSKFAEVTTCDELAANPYDSRHVGNGVPFPELRRNALAAISACDLAISANPHEPRFFYQKARALQAANDPRAQPLLENLMQEKYAASFDNAAQLLANQGRWQEAANLYRQGVRLNDVDAMVSLADAIRANRIAPLIQNEDGVLYQKAASLGHRGAAADVRQRASAGAVIDGVSRFFGPR
jgi:tetratricopeptide (TPR) repeat protein